MTQTFAAQVNRLPEDRQLGATLEYLCRESNHLYNCTLYLARQLYFKENKFSHGHWLSTQMKRNSHMKALYTSAAQQVCISVGEAFKGFKELLKLHKRGDLHFKPKPPNYRSSGGMYQISYPKRWLKLVDGQVRVPMGTACKVWFNLPEIWLPFPTHLNWDCVKELQIVPRAGYFDAVWISSDEYQVVGNLDPDLFLSIDPGLDNWLSCISNAGTSFIIDGKHLKALNQWYNKRVSTIKGNKPQGFWCNLLDRTTEKRNRQMRDAVNKAAHNVVEHCISNGIGTVIFGWNKGQKQECNMGRKNNQTAVAPLGETPRPHCLKFVQVPTAKVKDRIEQLCKKYGLRFVETEESYTSKADALALDEIPVYGEKPVCWKPSGTRTFRGLYRSAIGLEFNADINGALNIARKVTRSLGIDFNPRDLALRRFDFA